ncbi:MAG: DUF4386 domain-containing protein [Alphaproteobacteria bacterium]|nr:DUF4386 domain-containing protein [Alphaproteobacteria bacterium]MDE2496121.1 DUF4386 domain-containing protein [Alphaproteobacteria bacterium]
MSTLSSPRFEARIAGALYVLVIVLGAYAELVGRQGLVVNGDPGATLRAIAAHEHVYRLGFMAEMATNILAVPATVIIWRLLTPTGPNLALTALVLDLTQNTVNAMNAWTQFAPLTLLPGTPDLGAIPSAELAALARLALHWHDLGFQIGLSFFAFALLIEGWLVFRSGYFPKWLGLLYMLAGGCYLAAACDWFLALHLPISPYVQFGSLLGEACMALWLSIVGVNAGKWRAAAER